MNAQDFPDIFEPFERLVDIEIIGVKRKVPENNTLLRCFQFLAMNAISQGNFCWNGDCLNCQIRLKTGGTERSALACRTKVEENMKITRMSAEIILNEES